jgi:putative transposase
VGEIPLRIPRVRDGMYFPSLLGPRRRSEKALLAVVQQAYVEGVGSRRGDDLLQALGLKGVQLVTSDAHEGLKKALGQVLAGVSWQCCRVHFTRAPHCVRRSAGVRDLLAHVPRGDKSMVASALRTIFARPDRQAADVQLAEVVGVFPDGASVTRLVGAVLLEIADEWQVGRRYFSLEAMAKVIEPESLMVAELIPFHLAPVH